MKSVAWPAERIPLGRAKRIANKRLVEAGGVEPASGQNTNWLMVHHFRRNSLGIRCLLGDSLCYGVLSSALECSPVLETSWRRIEGISMFRITYRRKRATLAVAGQVHADVMRHHVGAASR